MDKNIVALLNNNLRVIIPDFGAFIIRQNEPRIVVFNESLKSNDGLLIEFIMKSEGVERDIASQLVTDYADHAKRTLESGNRFVIEGLGTLTRDSMGGVVWTSGEETDAVENIQAITEPDNLLLIEKEAEVLPENETEVIPEKQPEVIAEAETENVTEKQPEVEAEEKQETITDKETPSSLAPGTAQWQAIVDKVWRFRNSYAAKWLLAVILTNLMVIAFFVFKDDIRNAFRKEKSPMVLTDSVLNQLADSVMAVVNDTALVFSDSAKVTALGENEPSGGNLRYFIVAGCFRDEVNADDLVKSLHDIGFDAEKFGKIGNLYAVSFASFDDKELAVKELARIREEIHPDAWMTRF